MTRNQSPPGHPGVIEGVMEPKEIQIEDVSPVVKRVSVTLPQEGVVKELDRAYRQLARSAKVKGFRPGKAPRFVLERKFGPQVTDEVASRLINQTLPEIIKDRNLAVVVPPTIEAHDLPAGNDFTFTARIEIKPTLDLSDYSGLDLERTEPQVTEEMIDEQLDRLRDSQATLSPIEEDRPVAQGDWVSVSYQIMIDGQPLEGGRVENHDLEVGAGRFNDTIEAKLVGAARNQELQIEVAFPEDHPEPRLAGKTAVFQLTVGDIRRKVLPPLDDDLAKSLPIEADTLAALKDRIRDNLLEREQQKADDELRRAVLDRLHERVQFELPPTLVLREMDQMVASLRRRLAQAGSDPSALRFDEEKMREEMRPVAEKNLKDRILLAHVAAQQDLTATAEDENEELAKLAERYGQSVATLRDFYTNNQLLDELRNRIVEQKTLKFLTSGANIASVEASETKPADAAAAEDEGAAG
jgi:trigger factor